MTPMLFHTLFDTKLGRCGLVWGPGGIKAASFPEETDAATRARLLRGRSAAEETSSPPQAVARIIEDVRALFEGAPRDLAYADLDLDGLPEFDRAVFDLTLAIKPGETRAYGDLARDLGDAGLSRRVGQALGRNPIPIIVPCHRVVGANGLMTGFSAPGGTGAKMKLLRIEGALEPDLFDGLA